MDDRSVRAGQAYGDAAPTPDELSDGELDAVVGGTSAEAALARARAHVAEHGG